MRKRIISLITSLSVICFFILLPCCICSAYTFELNCENCSVINLQVSGIEVNSETDYIFQISDDVKVNGLDNLSFVDLLFEDAGIYRTSSLELIQELDSVDAIELYDEDIKVCLDSLDEDITELEYQDYRSAMLGYSYAAKNNIDGEGVKIAVIDSGLITEFSNYSSATILEGENFLVTAENEARKNTDDNFGHGTFVTSIICGDDIGLAPKVEILPLKCFDEQESDVSYIIEAIGNAVEADCDIINMSFGSTENIGTLKTAVEAAIEAGIIVVASSGNLSSYSGSNGNDSFRYPASYDGVISVGAVNSYKKIWNKSVQNDCVCVVAPGVNVKGLSNTSLEVVTGNGTSFSAPVVTAAAALALDADSALTPQTFREVLIRTAEDLGTEGKDNSYGYGLINPALLLATIREDTDSVILSKWGDKIGISGYLLTEGKVNYISCYSESGKMLSINSLIKLCNFEIAYGTTEVRKFTIDGVTFEPVKL